MPQDAPRWGWEGSSSGRWMVYLGPAEVQGQEASLYVRKIDGDDPRPPLFVRLGHGFTHYTFLNEGAREVSIENISRYGAHTVRPKSAYVEALTVARNRAMARGLYAR